MAEQRQLLDRLDLGVLVDAYALMLGLTPDQPRRLTKPLPEKARQLAERRRARQSTAQRRQAIESSAVAVSGVWAALDRLDALAETAHAPPLHRPEKHPDSRAPGLLMRTARALREFLLRLRRGADRC